MEYYFRTIDSALKKTLLFYMYSSRLSNGTAQPKLGHLFHVAKKYVIFSEFENEIDVERPTARIV